MLAAFRGLLVAGAIRFLPRGSRRFLFWYVVALGGLLFGVCWINSELPRWRWGTTDAPEIRTERKGE